MDCRELKLFITDCLLLSVYSFKRKSIENRLKLKNIDWNMVVTITTNQLVLPAFYYNLKKSDLINFVPQELVNYMKYIADLNEKRNEQIIKQCFNINKTLKSKNIFPVFIKGTGNLLAGLYENVTERMVGDIDFIVPKNKYLKTINILRSNGYYDVDKSKLHFPEQRHYRRLIKNNNISAIEIHKELILDKYASEFNYLTVKDNLQHINGYYLLGHTDKLCLTIFADQINNYNFYYKSISLKSLYDVVLISQILEKKSYHNNFKKLKKSFIFYFQAANFFCNNFEIIDLNKNKTSKNYLYLFEQNLDNTFLSKVFSKVIKHFIFLNYRINFILDAFKYKEYRMWIIKRILKK